MIDFLDHLYAHCDGGWVSLLTIDRTTGEKQVGWVQLGDWDTIDLPTGACAWFGAATRTERLTAGRRGGAADCAQVPALWVDIDIQSPVHAADDLPADIDQARQLLDAYPLAPTCVVDSGNGLQAWWLLDEPLDAAEAATVLADWGTTWNVLGHRRGWHVDNVFDVARVMRLPGTLNHKTDPARPVTIIEVDWTRTYGLDEIDQHTIDAPPAPATPTRNGVPYIGPERPGDAYNAVTDPAEILERHGWVLDHTDRNGDRQYRAPHHADEKGVTGATVYDDGHATIWSETFARAHGLDVRIGYKPFHLVTMLDHGGDHAAAAADLRARGFGSDTSVGAFTPGSINDPWPEPIPLGNQIGELPAFPTHTLPDWMADHAWNVAGDLQMPVDLPAIVGIVALATIAGGRVTLNVRGPWTEPLNIYAAVAMPPSAGKSPAFAQMMAPVKAWEDRLIEEVKEKLPQHEQKKRMLEKQMSKAEAADDGRTAEDLLNELLRLGDMVSPRLTADDATPEALTQLLSEHDGRIAVLSTEGGLFDLMTGRYSDKANLDVYLKAWGGDTIIVDRIGRGASKIDRPALTIGLTVQPHVLAALADKPELAGRGLTARIMYALPPDNVGTRNYIDEQPYDDTVAARYMVEMTRIIDQTIAPGGATLTIAPDAVKMFRQWKQQLEYRRAPENDLRPLAEWSTKLESTTLRVAGLLHLADLRPATQPIDAATMGRAIEIGDYWLAHAFAVHDLWGADPVLNAARRILKWAQGRDRFTIRDVYRDDRRSFPRADDTIAPLTLLIERGWVRPVEDWPPRLGKGGKQSPELVTHPEMETCARSVPSVRAKQASNDPESGTCGVSVPSVPKGNTENYLSLSAKTETDTEHVGHSGHCAHSPDLAPTGTDPTPYLNDAGNIL